MTKRKIFTSLKWLFWLGCVALIGYLSMRFTIYLIFAGALEKTYTKEDLRNNYDTHGSQIVTLKHYFNGIVPVGKQVQIEFEGERKLAMFKISATDSIQHPEKNFLRWQIRIESREVDSLLPTLGWTRDTLASIKKKLEAASCIRVTNGEPGIIGYRRFGTGMFYYTIFENPIPDSLQPKYNNGCNAILYSNRVVLGFTGDPIGKQCFPKY